MQVRSNEATLPVVPLHGEFALTFSVISLRNCQFSWMSFAFTLPIQEGNYHVFDWNLFHFSVSSFQIWNYKNHSVNIYSFKLLSIFMFQKSHSFLMEEKVSLEICLLSSFSVLFFFLKKKIISKGFWLAEDSSSTSALWQTTDFSDFLWLWRKGR